MSVKKDTSADHKETRNFAIAAHVDAGKTTISERILFFSRKIHKMGEVHSGEAKMDWTKQERERGITVQSAATHFDWSCDGRDYNINLIDTPGHVDFTLEVERSLRVLDGAVLLLDAVEGVEPQTRTVWDQTVRHGVKVMFFVNKMDRMGASFESSFRSLGENFRKRFCPIVVSEADSFEKTYDLVEMKTYVWDTKGGFVSQEGIPESAMIYRKEMLNLLGETDDLILESLIEEKEPEKSSVLEAIKRGVNSGEIYPVMSGSALKNVGVQTLLDYVVRVFPAPEPSDSKDVKVFVFKVQTVPTVGLLFYLRVYEGTLRKGDRLYNLSSMKRFRINRIMKMHVIDIEEVEEAETGSIVCVSSVEATTGDTLASSPNAKVLYPIESLEPVVSLSINPKTNSPVDFEKILEALKGMSTEDPSLKVGTKDSGAVKDIVISGMGELHLQIVCDILKNTRGLSFEVSEPKVEYRSTLIQKRDEEHVLKRQFGGSGLWAKVNLIFEPLEDKSAMEFESKVVGGSVPPEFVNAVFEGIRYEAGVGVEGFPPLTGLKVTVYDGDTHPVDSKKMAFELAGRFALRQASESNMQIMEPIMSLNVLTHESFIGKISGDLSNRRGVLVGVDRKEHGNVEINAEAPLSEIFHYVNHLRSITSGRVVVHQSFERYDAVPKNLESKILAKIQ